MASVGKYSGDKKGLGRTNRLLIGRELRMAEFKEQIRELEKAVNKG
jgi:hypothetical protein